METKTYFNRRAKIRRKKISTTSELASSTTTNYTDISQITIAPNQMKQLEVSFDSSNLVELKQTKRVRIRSSKSISAKEYKKLQQDLISVQKVDFKESIETTFAEERSSKWLETHL